VFVSVEDETGIANALVHPWLFEQERLLITQEAYLVIEGILQARENTHIIEAEKIESISHDAGSGAVSHDFH
jgi:error-prone DNA polymerase